MSTSLDVLAAHLPPRYKVDRYLAKGGQGSVYLGTIDGTKAAIKLFAPGTDPRRLERELDALSNISCPHVVTLLAHDQIAIEGVPVSVVAYEFHSGGDLTALVSSAAPCPLETVLTIGINVGVGVQSLWQHRIVHRDIKPANIVKADDGRFVLVDIGFARHVDLTAISAIGQTAGTPGYMSPEQALGRRNLTLRSDVFSLGITLYELATKAHPFGRVQHSIGRATPRPLQALRSDLPTAFCDTVHAMMSTSPSTRPSDFVDRFLRLLGK